MRREAYSQDELAKVKSILESQYGVVFLPKTQLAVPGLDKNYITEIVGKENLDYAVKSLSYFYKYVCDCMPIADRFDKDHEKRRGWRLNMYKEFGDIFSVVYEYNNQLRTNNMDFGGPIHFLSLIEKRRGNIDRYEKLANLELIIDSKLKGKNVSNGEITEKSYDEMTLKEKLDIVHFNEQCCLEIIEMYSPNSNQNAISKT